jgi:uncharacterized protein YoxC
MSWEGAAWVTAIAFVFLVVRLVGTLSEVNATLRTYRAMESRIIPLLDNSRRITSNVEEITRQVTIQTARLDNITQEAQQVVGDVKKTVNIYNRSIAKPAILIASLASGFRSASSILFNRDSE